MGSNMPSLFPMLRLGAIALFCLLTYIHATATRGREIIEKLVRAATSGDLPASLTLGAPLLVVLLVATACLLARQIQAQAKQAKASATASAIQLF